MKYRLAALGGTFDRFHEGHRELLKTALSVAEKCVIGVTRSSLIQEKTLSRLIEPYVDRVQNVRQALEELHAQNRATVIPLNDTFGPAIDDPAIDVLVVSTQTKSGGDAINQARVQQGKKPLPIVETPMIQDDSGHHLSSTSVRLGKITRTGRIYESLFNQTITFSQATLASLKQVQGDILSETQLTAPFLRQFTQIGIVGDVVTRYFQDQHLPFTLAIIDGQTGRHTTVSIPQAAINLDLHNEPGRINHTVAQTIIQYQSTDSEPIILAIDGEEDLLAFVLCLTYPLDSAVFYGQPGKGIVMIKVTESVKQRLAHFIEPSFC